MATITFPVPYQGGVVTLQVALEGGIPIGTTTLMSVTGQTITVTKIDGALLYSGQNLQSAFTSAINSTSFPQIYVQYGTYTASSRITAQSVNNVTIIFEEGAKFVLANNVNTTVLFMTGVNNWFIENPEIDGNMANNSLLTDTNGIYFHNSTNCQVNHANIHHVRIFGFYVQYNCVNCGIINSTVAYCGWNGITLSTDGCVDSYALNNDVSHVGDVGISTYVKSRVNDNKVHDIDGVLGSGGNALGTHWAIGVEGGSDAEVLRNIIDNADCGVVVNNSGNTAYGTCDRTKIKANKMSNLKTVGVEIHSSNNEIGGDTPEEGNEILDWASWKNAVTIEPNGAGTANANLIKNNKFQSKNTNTIGVDVRAGSTNTNIQSNDFTGVTGTKINNAGTGTIIGSNTGYP